MVNGVFIYLLTLLLCSVLQEAILDIKRIRVSYLRTWFIPDVIAAFPIGYILLFAVIIKRKRQEKPTLYFFCTVYVSKKALLTLKQSYK